MTIEIAFGALAQKLHEQLGLPRRRLRYLQECADGLVHLSVGQLPVAPSPSVGAGAMQFNVGSED